MTNESLQKDSTAIDRFIGHLYDLKRRDDRGALAALRRGAGKVHPPAEFLRVVVPWCPASDWSRWAYFTVAGLFGLHPELGGSGSIGNAFRQFGDNESSERRFVALLNSHVDDLPQRLRQTVSLARSKKVPLDWSRLLQDLLYWSHEKRFVQERWACDYWQGVTAEHLNELEIPSFDNEDTELSSN